MGNTFDKFCCHASGTLLTPQRSLQELNLFDQQQPSADPPRIHLSIPLEPRSSFRHLEEMLGDVSQAYIIGRELGYGRYGVVRIA